LTDATQELTLSADAHGTNWSGVEHSVPAMRTGTRKIDPPQAGAGPGSGGGTGIVHGTAAMAYACQRMVFCRGKAYEFSHDGTPGDSEPYAARHRADPLAPTERSKCR